MSTTKWTKEKIVEEIQQIDKDSLYSTAVKKSNGKLWKAAQRHFGSWKNAVEAAGFEYESLVRWGPRVAPNKGTGGTCTYPGCTKPHHANGYCQHHDNHFRYLTTKNNK